MFRGLEWKYEEERECFLAYPTSCNHGVDLSLTVDLQDCDLAILAEFRGRVGLALYFFVDFAAGGEEAFVGEDLFGVLGFEECCPGCDHVVSCCPSSCVMFVSCSRIHWRGANIRAFI